MNSITEINYGFHGADLFAGWDNPEKYDIPASAAKYAEIIQARLQQEYPSATITTPYDLDAGGVLPAPLQCSITDGTGFDDTDHADIPAIEHLASLIYQEYEWVVEN